MGNMMFQTINPLLGHLINTIGRWLRLSRGLCNIPAASYWTKWRIARTKLGAGSAQSHLPQNWISHVNANHPNGLNVPHFLLNWLREIRSHPIDRFSLPLLQGFPSNIIYIYILYWFSLLKEHTHWVWRPTTSSWHRHRWIQGPPASAKKFRSLKVQYLELHHAFADHWFLVLGAAVTYGDTLLAMSWKYDGHISALSLGYDFNVYYHFQIYIYIMHIYKYNCIYIYYIYN